MVVKKASYVTRRPLKELNFLRYKKQNFLDIFRPRAEEYETIGFIFWHDFRKCILFAEMKVGSVNTCFLICFRTLSVNFFRFLARILWEGCQKCNFCLQKIFLKRWQVLRNSFFLISEFDCENFWLLAQNFCMVLETEFQVTTGFFPGKECINKNFNSWFFPEFERKTAPISVNFFWRSVKRQSMTAEELL